MMQLPFLTLAVALLGVGVAVAADSGSDFHQSFHKVMQSPFISSITMVITKQEESCVFAESRKAGARVLMAFALTRGSADFDVVVKAPGGLQVYVSRSGEHEGEDRIFFETQTEGEYALCIDNRHHSTTAPKAIRVTVGALSRRRAEKTIDPLSKILSKSSNGLRTLLNEQDYIRNRESRHRETLESNNTRAVLRWIVEAVVIVGLSISQVVFLKRVVSRNKKGRVA